MSDRVIKEFMGFNELRETKDGKTIYLNLLYMGGRFNVRATNSFQIDNSTGVPALKHLPTGKIYSHDKPFIAVAEAEIINALAFKRQQDVFTPRVLVNIEPIPSGAAPLPKMEEKKK